MTARLGLILAALILAACGPGAGSLTSAGANTTASNAAIVEVAAANAKPGSEQEATNTAESAEAAACRAQGGIYGPVCLAQTPECVMPYRDAGRSCDDGSDCLSGRCYYDGPRVDAGARVSGRCAPNSNECGCHARVEGGRTEGALCVD